jgi:hypothetical protein
MKRYRKGSMWRPPTAAESAATADAVEGFRRRPPVAPDPVSAGKDIIVKTPAGGIDARSSTTLSSALCNLCIEIDSSSYEKTIVETDQQIIVYNIYPDDVTGDVYAITSLTATGTRYVSGEPCP